jgi:lipoprotein-anchoring transpeptidase ErfK/SrfK
MIIRGKLGLAVAAGLLAALFALQAVPASAQLLYDWGGSNTIGGSGREVVAFNPKYGAGQIIVSFGDRRLYFITQPGQAISYPIAVPREQSRWQGVTSVSQKRVNPSWTPTPTMLAENPRLPRWVPGGHPMNPLGVRGIYLGSSMYRIHGTDAPWTIGTAVSKGCIRLYNQDVLDLYPRVSIGAKVTVTYDRFTTGPAVAAKTPVPRKGMVDAQPEGNFFFFGDDEPPVKVKRKRAHRTKARRPAADKSAAAHKAAPAASSAQSENSLAARKDLATDTNAPAGKGVLSETSAPAE